MLRMMNQLKDRSVFMLSLLFLLTVFAGFLLYDYNVRSNYAKERTYYFQQHHEKAFSSLYLFSDKIQSIYRQMLQNRDLREWLTIPGEIAPEMYRLSQIQSSFFDVINSHSGIASIYLHNKKNNMILSTPFMLSELPQFPNRSIFEQYDYSDATQWSWSVLPNEMKDNPGSSAIISMTAGIPSRNKTGALAINLNQAYVADTLMKDNAYVLWLDPNDQVLLAKNEETKDFFLKFAEHILSVKQAPYLYKDHLVLSSASDIGGWKLITIIPQDILVQGQPGNPLYKYLILLVCFALGLLLFLYFRYTRREQEKLHEVRVKQNMDDFQKGLITDLLTGKPLPEGQEQKAKAYGLNLKGVAYQVVVFEIDDYYNFLRSKSDSERFFMNKILYNAIKWTFVLRFNAHPVNSGLDRVTVLLCYDELNDEVRDELERTIRYIQNDIRDNCGLTVCTGVSNVVRELEQVHSCYANAAMAVEYKSIYGKHSVIYYDKLGLTGATSLMKFSKEIHRIHDYLKAGNVSKIEESLHSILDELIRNEQFTLEWIHAFFANIMASIMKYAFENRIDINHLCKEDVFITLYSYEFLEEKKAYILKLCSVMIEQMRSKPEEASTTGKVIIEYIDKHFDKPISLNILAEKLALSPSYLSVYIKNQLGVGFVEYISTLRVQKALKLMDNESLTIQQIAEQCGYDTVHTFIRQFKKVHQLPPNEYRTQRRNKKM
ncbi:helix-turn-helix domain-containing protein [Paenibacillus sp. GD4]|jgi:AraC-like DNA-binding protein|uniref:helix-turn-helix domain-containing protein n=1 Tax=Paenibacillus sp. GD4 TaxID=3068890 RepID=UPI0027965756|nr:helix-turn-helix domain-containing protein [Paenibacillus sp. GD4]MDQ1914916.1 helix-turn-helix domain-containing protein [Paenibacillus sp. GD4]